MVPGSSAKICKTRSQMRIVLAPGPSPFNVSLEINLSDKNLAAGYLEHHRYTSNINPFHHLVKIVMLYL